MIKKITKNQSGASILFAVIAMLVVVMVTTVILFAAETNITRAARNRKEQQAYLTVSSAANLVTEVLSDGKIYFDVAKEVPMLLTYDHETMQLLSKVPQGEVEYTVPDNISEYHFRPNGGEEETGNYIANAVKKCIQTKLCFPAAASSDTVENFRLTLRDDGSGLDQVCLVKLTMDGGYNVKAEIKLDTEDESDPNCFVTMDFRYLAVGVGGNAYSLMEDVENEVNLSSSDVEVVDIGDEDEHGHITETIVVKQNIMGCFTWNKENMTIKKGAA